MYFPPDETHDPHLRSWVTTANLPNTDFPIQNLPFGLFRHQHRTELPRIGVAIGDQIVDLSRCVQKGLLDYVPDPVQQACHQHQLNNLMGLGPTAINGLRHQLSHALNSAVRHPDPSILVPMADAVLLRPAMIGDYTDFYASLHHATNVGKLFRPNNPLLPNYKHIPIAYHGRASSIVVSGTPIYRPMGQQRPTSPDTLPTMVPTRRLDYEAEVGLFVGQGNALGQAVPMAEAESHLFGVCLVNDWSARDIQAWEYQPLGPFLGKSFATTISPWIVTLDSLAPFRCKPWARSPQDPALLPYLHHPHPLGGINLSLEVWIRSAKMQHDHMAPMRISQSSFAQLYWTPAQMVAHHTSNGCNLRPGDLLASGTVSGESRDSWGSLLEITQQGKQPIRLPSGEQRTFLADGDEVIMRGYCEAEGYRRIGLGECRGHIHRRH